MKEQEKKCVKEIRNNGGHNNSSYNGDSFLVIEIFFFFFVGDSTIGILIGMSKI